MNYSFDRVEFKRILLSDSSSGILPITNTLDFFKIKNLTAKVPKASFNKLPNAFIAQILYKDEYNWVLVNKENDLVHLIIDKKTKERLTSKDFINIWTGLIIAIEENKGSISRKNNKKIPLYILFVCTILINIHIWISYKSLMTSLHFTLSIFGLIFSWIAVEEKLSLKAGSKFCSFSKNVDCKKVLNSSKARLFDFIDLSDISIVYFTFLVIIPLYGQNNYLSFITATLSIAIVLYSIYIQFFVIKKQCTLCLAIAIVLTLQFLILLPYKGEIIINEIFSFIVIGLLGIISTTWYLIKNLLINNLKKEKLVIENLKFRRNREIFLSYYTSLNTIETDIENTLEIKLGTKNPIVSLIIITDPLCENCFKAHTSYNRLLNEHKDKVQIIIRFLVPYYDRHDPRTQISERLLQLYKKDENIFLEAYNDWYSVNNIKKWFDRWGYSDDKSYNNELHRYNIWSLKYGLNYTPATIVNKKILSQNYNIEDIENLIKPIIEFEEKVHA